MFRWRNILLVLLLLLFVIAVGVSGFMTIEGMSFIDALYMTAITISTVGFGEVIKLSTEGRLFTIFLIFAGLGTAAYALKSITSFVIEGDFHKLIRRHMMENKIESLSGHYIVCGAGQTGFHIIAQLHRKKVPFVVIEKNESRANYLAENNFLVLAGDASSEETLKKARIEKAKGLISSLSTDADNVFTVLTARELAPDLHIVARAIERKADLKLRKAGADTTVSPNEIGGTRMASLVLRPAVVSFLDVITHAKDITLDLEEIAIDADSSLTGKSLKEVRIPEKTGLIVLALSIAGEEKLEVNPGSEQVLREGDKMIVFGQSKQIDLLRRMCCE